jgi:predicted anti-sigma-YlaC factor YlaD
MSNTKHVTVNLSAYLDGLLNAGERAQLEAHLRSCSGCQADLNSLRYVVTMTRSLPEMRAPRSFTLSPEMAAQARPYRQFGWIYASMRGFTALAAVLLVMVCSADFLAVSRSGGLGSAAPAPAAMSVPSTRQTASEASDQAQNQTKSSATSAVPTAPAGAAASAPSPVPAGVATSAAAQAVQAPTSRASQLPRAADGTSFAPGTARSAIVTPSATGAITPTNSPAASATPPPTATVTFTPVATPPTAAAPPASAAVTETFPFRVAEIWLLGALSLGLIATQVLRAARR